METAAVEAIAFDWTPWLGAASALLGALIGAAAGIIGPLVLDARRRRAEDAARAKAARGEAIIEWTSAAVELANVHGQEGFTRRDYRGPASRSNTAMAKLRMSLTGSGDVEVREFARRVHAMTSEHSTDGDLERRVAARGSDMLIEWHETGHADFRPFAYLPDLVIGETWDDALGATRLWFAAYRRAAAKVHAEEADAKLAAEEEE